MKKINLAISGCFGRMGQQLIKSSKSNKNFKLVVLTENKPLNKKIAGIKLELNTDQAFKEKCILEISKIIEQKKKAIIFVSHDRYLNKKICKYGVVLKNGNLSKIMKIDEAYDYYDLINKKNINN